MLIKELREQIKNLPDDAEVIICIQKERRMYAEVNNAEFFTTSNELWIYSDS